MQKAVTYLFPISYKASHLKVFQDRMNPIKAFYFTKENIKEIETMDSSSNYAVYFLFDDSDDSVVSSVYVGQSMNGVHRIKNHVAGKDFWSYCIMFVTDNNSFDKLTIDYMEYAFIKKFKKSSYILTNKELRDNEPIVSMYDMPKILAFIEQVEFLLNAERIEIDEKINTEQLMLPVNKSKEIRYYEPVRAYHKAKIYIEDGKFILTPGSIIVRPSESSKNYSGGQYYERNNRIIDEFIEDGKVVADGDGYKVQVNLSFKSPSSISTLISGTVING